MWRVRGEEGAWEVAGIEADDEAEADEMD